MEQLVDVNQLAVINYGWYLSDVDGAVTCVRRPRLVSILQQNEDYYVVFLHGNALVNWGCGPSDPQSLAIVTDQYVLPLFVDDHVLDCLYDNERVPFVSHSQCLCDKNCWQMATLTCKGCGGADANLLPTHAYTLDNPIPTEVYCRLCAPHVSCITVNSLNKPSN